MLRRTNSPTKASDYQCRWFLRGLYLQFFVVFFISFREIQNLDDLKNEKLKTLFIELLAFRPSRFWIFQKLIYKSDKKLKQTPPVPVSFCQGWCIIGPYSWAGIYQLALANLTNRIGDLWVWAMASYQFRITRWAQASGEQDHCNRLQKMIYIMWNIWKKRCRRVYDQRAAPPSY
jgi:hypothetical protein